MSTVVVRGLDEEGPGDIVGAFVNEAVVELADGTADAVVDTMDGGRVGRSEMKSVRRREEGLCLDRYVNDVTYQWMKDALEAHTVDGNRC